jgi:hypothetical protein
LTSGGGQSTYPRRTLRRRLRMNFIVQTIVNTPLWVWALLAFLLYIGIRALQPSTAPLSRIAILPTVFLAWGLYGLFSMHALTLSRVLPWLAAIGCGVAVGLVVAGLQPIRADKVRRLVRAPGGPLTLALILGIFATKYVFGVLHETDPAAFAQPRFWLSELALSGVLTGMFIGRFVGLWRQYRAAPHEDLDTGSVAA